MPEMGEPSTIERGILVAIEGIDGAGKTTQVSLLAEALRQAGEQVVTSKEPTGGKWGQQIRASAEKGRLPVRKELLAFIEDRHEHVAETIAPALARGEIVILDRYFYSTIAYQGARGLDWRWLDRYMKTLAPIPDTVYVLDVDPVVSLQRIQHGRGESPNEFERVESLREARAIFQKLCRVDPVLCEIDGSMSPAAVHAEIVGAFIKGPLRVKRCAKEYGCDDPSRCAACLSGDCNWVRLAQRLVDAVEEPYRAVAMEGAAMSWTES
jgi:dTMP kinase